MGWTKRGFVIIFFLVLSGCAYSQKGIHERPHTLYMAYGQEKSLLTRFAPLFLTYNYREPYNRIGRPSARFDKQGNEQIYVDHQRPTIYYLMRNFSTEKGKYRNLIYRVHFPEIPFSLVPFYISAGKNVGLIVIITIDERQRPLLVTTVGTCGCYVAIVPTSFLSPKAFPPGWKNRPLTVYGERLPPLIDLKDLKNPRLVIYIRSGVHRVMDLQAVEEKSLENPGLFSLIKTPLIPMEALHRLPVNAKTTGFFYDSGPLKGHVKGAVKPWETLLLSLISLDLFVGTDKEYGDSHLTGNPFYTSLKPWNRSASDMWEFARFLKFWGWRL